jgi:hypothetical protein
MRRRCAEVGPWAVDWGKGVVSRFSLAFGRGVYFNYGLFSEVTMPSFENFLLFWNDGLRGDCSG